MTLNLKHIPGTDRMIIITNEHNTATLGEIHRGSTKNNTGLAERLELLVSPKIIKMDLEKHEKLKTTPTYRGGGGKLKPNLLIKTHSAIISSHSNGLSTWEELNSIN